MIETFTALATALAFVEVEQRGFEEAVALGRHCRTSRARVFFIGNGGSAAIASHMAEDWLKAGNIAAMAFNDAALITCLTNDLGYDTVFSAPLKVHGGPWDVLVAISSSGRSSNILKAVETAKGLKMRVVTLSGFTPNNPLRGQGDINFYVPSDRYGIVETAHLAICHAMLDRIVDV